MHFADHTLKGSSGYLGALQFTAQCKAIEDLGRSGDLDKAASVFQQVECEYERAAAALEGLL